MKNYRPERKVERSSRDLKSKGGWIKRFDCVAPGLDMSCRRLLYSTSGCHSAQRER